MPNKVIHINQNVDKNGIFYNIKKLPTKLKKKFETYYDKKNEDWFFEEDDIGRAKKIIKSRGYKVKVAKLASAVMTLGQALSEFKGKKIPRLKTKYKPLDTLLNGGMVKGAVVLVSGEPGAGKSTLSTQLMLHWSQGIKMKDERCFGCRRVLGKRHKRQCVFYLKSAKKVKKVHTFRPRRCIYINTEENIEQVQDRFKRLNENQPFTEQQKDNLVIIVQKDINLVRATLKKETADVVILDSLGGFVEANSGTRGGGRILKDASGIIHDYVKENNSRAVAIMVGHINKKGKIAGPEALQHMADTVLFIQGSGRVRTIQPTKNRFGDTSGMISVAMTETGLEFEDSHSMERDVTPGQQVAKIGDGWSPME